MTDVTAPTPGDRLRAALATNGQTTPDAVAAAQNRARQLGAPRGALTYVPAQEWPVPQQNFDIEEFLRKSPRTANYLSNVDNAQIAGDPASRDNLSDLERALMRPVDPRFRNPDVNSRRPTDTLTPLRRENTPGNWLRGIATAFIAGEAVEGTQLALGDALGLWRNPAERASAQRSYDQATARVEMARPELQGNFQTGVYGGLESIARQIPGVALSLALRNPAPALAAAGGQTGGQAYGRYSARGATPGEAALGAGGEAAVEVLTELIPMGRLVGALGADGAKKFITEIGKSALADIPGEQLATLAQDAIDTAVANPDKTWADYLEERPDAAVQTLVASLTQSVLLGGAAAGVRAAGGYADRQAQTAAAAEMDAATISNLVEGAANSPLRTRSPEAFSEFMAQAAEGGPVSDLYISADALNQSGVDVAALRAAVPAIDQQLDQAAETGGDVRIPVEQFATRALDIEGADGLVDHMRINPALPSRAEVSALTGSQAAELQAQAQQVLADATTDDAFRRSAEAVETGFYEQLQAAGRFTKDVNRSYASLVGSFYAVQAKRIGLTPEQMAERYPLKITAELPQANRPAVLDQTAGEMVSLVHFSRAESLTETDPKKWGTNRTALPASERASSGTAPPRTYFYDRALRTSPEAAVAQTSPFRYAAEVPRASLYDFDADPQGLRASNSGAAYENAIQEAGFSGYFSNAVVPGAVAIFDPVPPRPEGLIRTRRQAQAVEARQFELQHEERMARVRASDADTMVVSLPLERFRAKALAEVFAASPELAPLEGAPKSVKVNGETQKIAPYAPAREAAYAYMESRGLVYEPPTAYAKVDTERAGRIADAFDLMAHNPDDPIVRAAYSAMIEETLAQYQFVKATGLEIEFITGDDPYATSPRLAIQDVVENNHLWVFPTDDGFGGSESAGVDVSGNPLLAMTDEWIGDRQLRANDVFRIVHDYFGHIKDGFGFRADGEENAWQSHAAMFTPLARRAMTTETRGQNSWVNYGPFGEFNKTASGADTQYAPQKIGLLPTWVGQEGFLGGANSGRPVGQTLNQGPELETDTAEFKAWFGDSKVVDESGQPLVVYRGQHGGTGDIESRLPSLSFGSREAASLYAESPNNRADTAEAPTVFPVYLSIQNPIINDPTDPYIDLSVLIDAIGFDQAARLARAIGVTETGAWESGFSGFDGLEDLLARAPERLGELPLPAFRVLDDAGAVEALKAAGFDGAIHVGTGQTAEEVEYRAFDQRQVKSVFNRGTFDPADPDILFQSENAEVRPHPAFYSALLRAVAKAPQAKASAAQWKATLAKTPGVKKDEIEWSGLNEWLDSHMPFNEEHRAFLVSRGAIDAKGNIPREQIVAFLENGGVQVEEVLLGENPVTSAQIDARAEEILDEMEQEAIESGDFYGNHYASEVEPDEDGEGGGWAVFYDGRQVSTAVYETEDEAEEDADEANSEEVNEALREFRSSRRYEAEQQAERELEEVNGAQFSAYKLPGADDTYRELLLTLPRIDGPSTHWDQPNVVAHTRFTTRTDASGAKVLFLEELQSDWHQKGRDEGYESDATPEARAAALAARDAAYDAHDKAAASFVEVIRAQLTEDLVATAGARQQAADMGMSESMQANLADGVNEIKHALARLDREIELASEGGRIRDAAAIASNIMRRAENGGLMMRHRTPLLLSARSAFEDSQLVWRETQVAMDALEMGVPDAPFRTSWAQLVMKRMISYAVENGFDKIAWINGNQQNGGQTGGDGSFFYERNLVNTTNDLLKKLGGRVEQIDFVGYMPRQELNRLRADRDAFSTATGVDESATYQVAIENISRPPRLLGEQNGFVINDQMRAQAADGFALFQRSRGQIALGQDITQTPTVISLLRTADLSTFLHETGHFFLEVTRDMASREDAPAEIKQDFDTLLSWFGVADAAAWQSMPFEDKRKYHEQFARGFEAFLMEGRAPTPALRELFQRFRSWLLNVYRSLTALNVELTDEVRSVMGRMVAAQDEVVAAIAEYGFTPLAEKPPYMDAASWADYQGAFFAATEEGVDTLTTRAVRDMKWLSNARSKALRRLQHQARLQRREVKAEVTGEVMAEPVNRARTYLRRGVGPDGEPVPGALKLDRAALEAAYGTGPDAIWRKLRSTGKYGEVQTDGLDPDVAAELFGYDSGDALVQDLATAEDANEKIAGLTDQRMLERYGDLADETGIERAADEAVANDAHIRAIATDYAALAVATGQPRALAGAAREHAARIVNSIPLKRLKPAQFFAAMTRAGKAADKAAKSGDLVLAATNRRNQLINLQAAKYALEAKAEVDKGLTRFQRIVSANDEALTRSRDMALVNAARAILNLYGYGRAKNDPASYLERVKSYDPQLYADIQPFVEGARGGAKPLDLITYEQFQGLRDTVNQLWALSLRTRQIELDGRLVDLKVAQAALSARLDEIGVDVPVGQDRAPTDGERFSRGLQGARAALRRVESWARSVDAADRGPFRSYIWNPVSTAADRYRVAQADYIRRFLALVEPIKGTLKNKKIAAPEIGYTFSGKAELLHAVLHSGNTSNLSKLLLGRRWGEQTEDGALDTTRWDAFLERAWAEGVLTKADYDFAQGVWDLLESTKPAAQAAHRAMYGRYFSEVTAQPVRTPFGEYAGGYVPATTDSFMVQDAALRQEQEALEDSNAFMFPAASNGFTKSRVEDYTRELSLDIRLLPMHLDKVLKFTYLGPPVRDVARLLKGKEFSAKMNAFDPVAATDLLLPWLQRSARQVVQEPTKGWGGKHLDAFFREARSRTGMQIMFANLSNVLQQLTSFANAAVRVRPARIGEGLWAYVRDPKGTTEAVYGLSDFMKTRSNAQVFEMRQSIEQILLDANGLDRLRDFAARHAYFFQQAVQNVTDVAVWKGAFDQAVERGDSDLEAVRFADSVIRETQSSLSPEDISRFETGTPFVRFFTQFYSYFNNQANLLGTEGLVVARTAGVKNGMGRLLYVYVMGFAVPALLGQAIADLMRGGWEDDEEDGYFDEFLQWFFMSQVKFGLAAVPIGGAAANAAIGGFTPATFDDRVSISPAISLFDASLALPSAYYDAVINGEGLNAKEVRDTMNMLGLISGLPIGALGRPAAYTYGVAADQIDPAGPADAARGVVTGTASPGTRVQ